VTVQGDEDAASVEVAAYNLSGSADLTYGRSWLRWHPSAPRTPWIL